ncbi:uncharacterized protein YALI1_A17103g [Yarrowia lipolytica]|uniref:Uncharacterized protein n=1 Tax=Yarrowia lipolytica TaxID=4952 RepID=A0A1D8N560_YARLL|nr:hypothetical protein YALI1_A17103g [Yarrowia lipolytica]
MRLAMRAEELVEDSLVEDSLETHGLEVSSRIGVSLISIRINQISSPIAHHQLRLGQTLTTGHLLGFLYYKWCKYVYHSNQLGTSSRLTVFITSLVLVNRAKSWKMIYHLQLKTVRTYTTHSLLTHSSLRKDPLELQEALSTSLRVVSDRSLGFRLIIRRLCLSSIEETSMIRKEDHGPDACPWPESCSPVDTIAYHDALLTLQVAHAANTAHAD